VGRRNREYPAPTCASGCGARPTIRSTGKPEWFELGFGLSERAHRDPHSSADPVAIEGGLSLRGSIDLLERDPGGRNSCDRSQDRESARREELRDWRRQDAAAGLYALAAEQVLGEKIYAGRLYYCTAAGGYEERVVEINDEARRGRVISSRSSRKRWKQDFSRRAGRSRV